MVFSEIIQLIADYFLLISCLFILVGSIWLTIMTRFVQLRLFPVLFKMLKKSFIDRNEKENCHTIPPHRALFTAMSTTLGIGTIVAPVIAISLGGPGALLGFLLTSFFGSAATYVEVNLSIRHRKRTGNGEIMGGPMQYIKHILSPAAGKLYAISCFILMIAWSGAQSNQLAAILDSPLLGAYSIPKAISGGIVAVMVLLLLMGGIKRIGAFSAKLVPVMFVLYLGSSFWILCSNLDKFYEICVQMIHSVVSPYEMGTGIVVGGIVSSLRWGVFKGLQVSEAGIGTQTIPHSMAETEDPIAQGAVAMLSTYTAGIVAFLSGCVALITKTWENPDLPLGINMVAASFQIYFGSFGIAVVGVSAILFAFGTILGNGFNGSQCFNYLTNNKMTGCYFALMAFMVFIGTIAEVKTFWAFTDLILAFMALLHITTLVRHIYLERREKVCILDQA